MINSHGIFATLRGSLEFDCVLSYSFTKTMIVEIVPFALFPLISVVLYYLLVFV